MANRVGFARRPEPPVYAPRPWALIGYVRFLGLAARSTPDSRRRRARSAKTESDPTQTSSTMNYALRYSQRNTMDSVSGLLSL